MSLHVRDQQTGDGTIMTQPGKFGLGGGLIVGRSGAEPVTDNYPGQRPWAFTGGTVKRVVIDVSGTPGQGSSGRLRPPVTSSGDGGARESP